MYASKSELAFNLLGANVPVAYMRVALYASRQQITHRAHGAITSWPEDRFDNFVGAYNDERPRRALKW